MNYGPSIKYDTLVTHSFIRAMPLKGDTPTDRNHTVFYLLQYHCFLPHLFAPLQALLKPQLFESTFLVKLWSSKDPVLSDSFSLTQARCLERWIFDRNL